MTTDLTGQVAIITGGSRGIGYAIARRLAQAGADVGIVSLHEGDAKCAAESLATLGIRAVGVGADLSCIDEIPIAFRRIQEILARVDILINNAGIAIRAPVFEVSEAIWDRVLDVNLKAVFFCAQSAAREMAGRGGGTIINITSVASMVGQRNQAPYAASKGGVAMLTKVLALELAEHKIRVNAIAPGSIRTDLNREYLAKPENLSKNLSLIPLKRIGDPDDVAGIAAFLCTADASYITGATFVVDGGWTIE